MMKVSDHMKIIDNELAKFHHSHLEKGSNDQGLQYKMNLKGNLKLIVSKLINGDGTHGEYDVDYLVLRGDETLIQGTIDIRELARKCNEINNKC